MLSVRDAIVSVLKTEVPEFRSVEGHDGDFRISEIQRHLGHGTAARVVSMGIPDVEAEADVPTARARWGVFIAAMARTANHADGQASAGDVGMLLATKVVSVVMIRNQRWNSTAFGQPENVRAQNLFSQKTSKAGVGLWLVQWDQTVEITEQLVSDLDTFRLVHTDWDVSPIQDGEELESNAVLTTHELGTQSGDTLTTWDGDPLGVVGVS